jgi:hypothetical protein
MRPPTRRSNDPPAPGAMDMSGGAETTVPSWRPGSGPLRRAVGGGAPAVTRPDTPAKARGGRVRQRPCRSPAIGVHWVNWTPYRQAVRPAHSGDAALRPASSPRLVGFSYWIHARAGWLRWRQRRSAPAHQPVHRQRVGRDRDGRHPADWLVVPGWLRTSDAPRLRCLATRTRLVRLPSTTRRCACGSRHAGHRPPPAGLT